LRSCFVDAKVPKDPKVHKAKKDLKASVVHKAKKGSRALLASSPSEQFATTVPHAARSLVMTTSESLALT
jgi:hypothetical protein